MSTDTLTLLVPPGVNPGRWVATWRERYRTPLEVEVVAATEVQHLLRQRPGTVGFVRLPLTEPDLAAIPLWEETTVVVASKEDELSLAEDLTVSELAGSVHVRTPQDALAWAGEVAPGCEAFGGFTPTDAVGAVELVAAGAGVWVVPASLARAHARRDVVAVPLTDAPTSRVALAWLPEAGEAPPLVDDLIGVVRGRTAASSRGRPAAESVARTTAPATGSQRRTPRTGASSAKRPTGGRASRPARPGRRRSR